jgi:hypothetical protein
MILCFIPLPNATFLPPPRSHKVGKLMEEKESREIDGREIKEIDENKLCCAHDCENLWVLLAHSLKSVGGTEASK